MFNYDGIGVLKRLKMSASRKVKLQGLKSVKEMADLVGYSESHIHKLYASDREMFDALLERAIRTKTRNETNA